MKRQGWWVTQLITHTLTPKSPIWRLQLIGLWEGAGEPGENPRAHGDNMQTTCVSLDCRRPEEPHTDNVLTQSPTPRCRPSGRTTLHIRRSRCRCRRPLDSSCRTLTRNTSHHNRSLVALKVFHSVWIPPQCLTALAAVDCGSGDSSGFCCLHPGPFSYCTCHPAHPDEPKGPLQTQL